MANGYYNTASFAITNDKWYISDANNLKPVF